MTPTENFNGNPMMNGRAKMTSAINVLAGIWLFVSPWVYGSYESANSWNSWIVGVAIVIFAAIQYNNVRGIRFLSWLNCLLGIWVFFSPWIYGYTFNTGRFVNSLCVGVIVAVLALSNLVRAPQQPLVRRMQ